LTSGWRGSIAAFLRTIVCLVYYCGVRATTGNLGFLLAKAAQRWNALLIERFTASGFPEVRPSYGSVLLPLFEQDGLRMGQLAERSRLSKQSITKLVGLCERDQLVTREHDEADGRAYCVRLTARAHVFQLVVENVLAELDDMVLNALGQPQTDALTQALKGVAEL
jgi:DNA-binding MarR family transcriptional regulator